MTKTTLPPHYSTGDPDSFARHTFQKRIVRIIDQVIESPHTDDRRRHALSALSAEIRTGIIHDPFDDLLSHCDLLTTDEISTWRRAISPYDGRSWFDLPFYFAEAYLYLRLLIACGYFDEKSASHGRDPFQPFKDQELFSTGGGLDTGRIVSGMFENHGDGSQEPRESARKLLFNSLWGNRIDLSMFHLAERSKQILFSAQKENLLIDDSERLLALLRTAGRVDVILDNVGSELVCDLLLAWHLLSSRVRSVHFHAKKHPTYVSDSMPKDVHAAVNAMTRDDSRTLGSIGEDLLGFLQYGRFDVHSHYFWNSALHYDDLPRELLAELERSDLVILKGDVNYRRLLQDRRWDSWEKLSHRAPRCFPRPFATLRTMKSEIVVDIEKGRAESLSRIDPDWRINGERGIIRVVENGTACA